MAKKTLLTLLVPVCSIALLSACGHSPKRNSASSPYLSQTRDHLAPSFGLPVLTAAPAAR